MHRTLGPRASLLQVTLGIITFPGQFASSHSNSLAEMGKARVKCLSQEHNITTLPVSYPDLLRRNPIFSSPPAKRQGALTLKQAIILKT